MDTTTNPTELIGYTVIARRPVSGRRFHLQVDDVQVFTNGSVFLTGRIPSRTSGYIGTGCTFLSAVVEVVR